MIKDKTNNSILYSAYIFVKIYAVFISMQKVQLRLDAA